MCQALVFSKALRLYAAKQTYTAWLLYCSLGQHQPHLERWTAARSRKRGTIATMTHYGHDNIIDVVLAMQVAKLDKNAQLKRQKLLKLEEQVAKIRSQVGRLLRRMNADAPNLRWPQLLVMSFVDGRTESTSQGCLRVQKRGMACIIYMGEKACHMSIYWLLQFEIKLWGHRLDEESIFTCSCVVAAVWKVHCRCQEVRSRSSFLHC